MAELSSSKSISKKEIKLEKQPIPPMIAANKDIAPVNDNQIQVDTYDVFTSAVDIEMENVEKPAMVEQKAWQKTLIQKSTEISDSIQKSIPKIPEPAKLKTEELSALYSKMTDPMLKAQERVDRRKQEFVDIYDKLAAIYGEKEKDLKDKLSDTFKKNMPKIYDSLAEVDASMQQSEHGGQQLLRNRKLKDEKRKEYKGKKGIFFVINYKLLEIKGEILNFTNKIRAAVEKQHKTITDRVHIEYKKVKNNIIEQLDNIDIMFEYSKKKKEKSKTDKF